MTRERFAIALGAVLATFRVTLADEGLEGYWLVLHGLSEGELQRACLRAMAECEFMPPPARLLGYVKTERASNAQIRAADQQIRQLHAWRDGKSLDLVGEAIRELAAAKDANGRNGLK